ncbi:MAG: hypothetical protein K9M45_01860 [Kiritimatiellales bacterium]|nr:hypothetical protein [Kiritimatiellales bacterium]
MDLLELLELLGAMAAHGAWAFLNQRSYPNRSAYNNAVYRLRKQGLIVSEKGAGQTPVLKITDHGTNSIAEYLRPEKFWNRKWNGLWYLLMYDVPESERNYRNVLRSFLRKHRLGCLQKSVWVTPVDIRPEFDDLTHAAALFDFAYLFEARTVLGMPSDKVVSDAWDFESLYEVQNLFLDVYGENKAKLLSQPATDPTDLIALATEEINAYRCALVNDPLLPRALWPQNYVGERVVTMHRKLAVELHSKLVQSN